MTLFTDNDVEKKFASYPPDMRKKLLAIRELIFDIASHVNGIDSVEETLKWDELSYITKMEVR